MRGKGLPNEMGEVVDTPEGTPFQAPYPPGFPPVVRTITSIADGPPVTTLAADKAKVEQKPSSLHDEWVREKVSNLGRSVVMPKMEDGQQIFREPTAHAFVFLVDRDSCLLPIGVKVTPGPLSETEDLWDLKSLRRDAELNDWLDENRDCDDCLWVLWDLRESGTAVQALFDKWRIDHKISPEEMSKVAKCFLSQYVCYRDVELGFQALLPHAAEHEDFCRTVEINCDLIEERIRVKDAFVWDIRASDWDLTALLSNFVSDFQLDSCAVSSLFIDLKTTILRYRKEWATRTLERLTAENKINAAKLLPANLGLDAEQSMTHE